MHVLFLCPHGAAKSVIAAALTSDLSSKRGLDVTADNAGTDPDEVINPVAVEALAARGLEYLQSPRTVTEADIGEADVVVTLGCDLKSLPSVPTNFIDWSDVPNASVDVGALVEVLENRISALLDSAASV